jgi:hypothetical protein
LLRWIKYFNHNIGHFFTTKSYHFYVMIFCVMYFLLFNILGYIWAIMKRCGLKGLSHQIFKAFLWPVQYQICTFCVGADGF